MKFILSLFFPTENQTKAIFSQFNTELILFLLIPQENRQNAIRLHNTVRCTGIAKEAAGGLGSLILLLVNFFLEFT